MSYTDKKQLVKLVSYFSTFDGGLYRRGRCVNASFIMNMRAENRDYIEWVKMVLDQVTTATIGDRPDYNTDGCKRAPQLRISSRVHPFLTKIHSRIYIDKKKVIDPHMLRLMDAEALAIIFMADGGSHLDTRFKTPHGKLSLSTKGFSYGDNWLLKKAIKEKLGIEFNINRHNQYYYLSLRTKDINKFARMVLPHMCTSFLYKLERLSPVLGGDIVCTLRERGESGRNDQT